MRIGVLTEHTRLGLAIALLERGCRVSIACRLTELSVNAIRGLYRELHGTSPHGGQLPSTAAVIGTRARQVQASLWACLYSVLGGPETGRCIDAAALMEAHDLYLIVLRGQDQPATLDINDAWVVARDLRTGMAELRTCPRCRVCYLMCLDPRLPPTCPVCALRARALRAARGRQAASHAVEPGSPPARDPSPGT